MATVKSASSKSTRPVVSFYVRKDNYYGGAQVFDRAVAETVTVTTTNSAGKVISKVTQKENPQRLVGLCERARELLGINANDKYRLDITVVPLK